MRWEGSHKSTFSVSLGALCGCNGGGGLGVQWEALGCHEDALGVLKDVYMKKVIIKKLSK